MRRTVSIVVLLASGLVATPAAGQAGCALGWVVEASPTVEGASGADLFGVGGVAEDDVWAVGLYRSGAIGLERPLAQHWDGAAWTQVEIPGDLGGLLQGVDAVATDDAWAVGSIITASEQAKAVAFHWDGERWGRAAVPKPEPADRLVNTVFTDVAVLAPDDVWAVGRWSRFPQSPVETLVEHWDGESWEVVDTPALEDWHEFKSISAVGPDDIWAVGTQTFRAKRYLTDRALIEHWNGRRWRVVESPILGARLPFTLEGVDARSASDVWAVGGHTLLEKARTISFHWDGEEWSEMPIPDPSEELNLLSSVATVGRDHAIAVGTYYDADRIERTLVLRWDGERWTQARSEGGPKGNVLRDVIAMPPRHFTVGSYWTEGDEGEQRTLVVRRCSS